MKAAVSKTRVVRRICVSRGSRGCYKRPFRRNAQVMVCGWLNAFATSKHQTASIVIVYCIKQIFQEESIKSNKWHLLVSVSVAVVGCCTSYCFVYDNMILILMMMGAQEESNRLFRQFGMQSDKITMQKF